MPLLRRFGFAFLVILTSVWLGCNQPAPTNRVPPAGATANGDVLFCLWNAENLFDDKNDGRKGEGDKEYDPWLAGNPDMLKQKLGKLTEAILKLNGGKGPDILGLVEVESVRAAELLQKALNEKLADSSLHYGAPLMKEIAVGRHIAPVILTQLPVIRDRTRNYGSRFRIIQGHVVVNGHELVVMVSHWTSRLKPENEKGRRQYADQLYGAANAMFKSNPGVDVLICGDFNDSPADESVTKHLRATGDLQTVLAAKSDLKLYNLLANKNPAAGFGTHYHSKWFTFDQIVVSPGLLDQRGWTCETESVQVANELFRPGDRLKKPWRFGGQKEQGPRGYSDHFPVMVRLKVQREKLARVSQSGTRFAQSSAMTPPALEKSGKNHMFATTPYTIE